MSSFMQFLREFFKHAFSGNNSGTVVVPAQEVRMNKKALCVGINDYPGTGSDLAGCINDCDDWAAKLTEFGFGDIKLLKNYGATRQNILGGLEAMVGSAVAGDILAFTYSGHGSYVADTSNDEEDKKDETLYSYDGNILDDELRAIFNKLPADVSLFVVLDSCHSGTATRYAGPNAPKPRFMPPLTPIVDKPNAKAVIQRIMIPENDMTEVLLTGAKSTEYSYDANFGGRPNGALSYFAIKTLKPGITYQQWYEAIRQSLPSGDYPQTPQLEARDANKGKLVLT